MSTPPARRRQLRTWSPAGKQELVQAVTAGSACGPELLDLASNDYLSLCRHPSLIAAAEAIREGCRQRRNCDAAAWEQAAHGW